MASFSTAAKISSFKESANDFNDAFSFHDYLILKKHLCTAPPFGFPD